MKKILLFVFINSLFSHVDAMFQRFNYPNGIDQKTPQSDRRIKHKFTEREDTILQNLVNIHGTENWYLISENMPQRSPRQCRERWQNYLATSLNNNPWTPEENALLSSLTQKFGNKWRKISQYFEGRSTNTLKNHYQLLKRQQSKLDPTLQTNRSKEQPISVQTPLPKKATPITEHQAKPHLDLSNTYIQPQIQASKQQEHHVHFAPQTESILPTPRIRTTHNSSYQVARPAESVEQRQQPLLFDEPFVERPTDIYEPNYHPVFEADRFPEPLPEVPNDAMIEDRFSIWPNDDEQQGIGDHFDWY